MLVILERPNGVRCSLYEMMCVNYSCHASSTVIMRGKKVEFFGVNWQHWQLCRSVLAAIMLCVPRYNRGGIFRYNVFEVQM